MSTFHRCVAPLVPAMSSRDGSGGDGVGDVPLLRAFDRWKVGACKYLCARCDRVFPGQLQFFCHLQDDHRTVWEKYERQFGNPLLEAARIRCGLCQKNVLHDFVKLKVHLQRRHDGMDLLDYFAQHVYDGGTGREESSASLEVEEEGDGHEGGDQSQEAQDSEDVDMEAAHEEGETVAEEETTQGETVDKYQTWIRGCLYKCGYCGEDFHQPSIFRDHLIEQHRGDIKNRSLEEIILCGTVVQSYTR